MDIGDISIIIDDLLLRTLVGLIDFHQMLLHHVIILNRGWPWMGSSAPQSQTPKMGRDKKKRASSTNPKGKKKEKKKIRRVCLSSILRNSASCSPLAETAKGPNQRIPRPTEGLRLEPSSVLVVEQAAPEITVADPVRVENRGSFSTTRPATKLSPLLVELPWNSPQL